MFIFQVCHGVVVKILCCGCGCGCYPSLLIAGEEIDRRKAEGVMIARSSHGYSPILLFAPRVNFIIKHSLAIIAIAVGISSIRNISQPQLTNDVVVEG
eukprot:scaffold5671_cov36-Cyclotella_meneghiniana.AAC.4